MESCVGAGDIMGVAVPDAAPIEYGDAPAAADTHTLTRGLVLLEYTTITFSFDIDLIAIRKQQEDIIILFIYFNNLKQINLNRESIGAKRLAWSSSL